MSALTQPQKEELRFAVREQLVAAATVALSADMVRSRVTRSRALNFEPALHDVEAALVFLVSLAHATATPAALGATPYYQATAAGTLAHERGE